MVATSNLKSMFALCQPLCREAYQPGNRDTFVSGSDSGFLVTEESRLIVAIAGSNDVDDWLNRKFGNLHAQTEEMSDGVKLHAGIAAASKEIAEVIGPEILEFLQRNPECPVIFTGHSRGGAISQVLPLILELDQSAYTVVTFGSPKVVIGKVVQRAVHFQNWNDVVHRLPVHIRGSVVYQHCGDVVRKTIDGTIIDYKAPVPNVLWKLIAVILMIAGFLAIAGRKRFIPASCLRAVALAIESAHSIDRGYSLERWWPNEKNR